MRKGVNNLGTRLRAIRVISRLSQVELARKASIHQSAISRFERQGIGLGPKKRRAIAKALGVETVELFPELKKALREGERADG